VWNLASLAKGEHRLRVSENKVVRKSGSVVVWVVMSCSLVGGYQSFGGIWSENFEACKVRKIFEPILRRIMKRGCKKIYRLMRDFIVSSLCHMLLVGDQINYEMSGTCSTHGGDVETIHFSRNL
jgi:hypothetical protein